MNTNKINITFSSFLLFLKIYFDIRNSNVRLFDCSTVTAKPTKFHSGSAAKTLTVFSPCVLSILNLTAVAMRGLKLNLTKR